MISPDKHGEYNFPDILSFNLSWEQKSSKPTDILKILISLPDKFEIDTLFKIENKNYSNKLPQYQFKGMVCFTNGHYICYFRELLED